MSFPADSDTPAQPSYDRAKASDLPSRRLPGRVTSLAPRTYAGVSDSSRSDTDHEPEESRGRRQALAAVTVRLGIVGDETFQFVGRLDEDGHGFACGEGVRKSSELLRIS
jgi:hypothetical protein